ncbi:RSAM-modified peptide [Fusobacterium necrophorum subsp. funduliforme]|uniref:hypothetical protein n=1 Tax=Fusobacterium necrophorum TaxID=859 RepID=UPI00370F3DB7
MKLVKLSNKEIEQQGGVFMRYSNWEFSNHYGGFIRHKVYLLNGEEVFSFKNWEFKGV